MFQWFHWLPPLMLTGCLGPVRHFVFFTLLIFLHQTVSHFSCWPLCWGMLMWVYLRHHSQSSCHSSSIVQRSTRRHEAATPSFKTTRLQAAVDQRTWRTRKTAVDLSSLQETRSRCHCGKSLMILYRSVSIRLWTRTEILTMKAWNFQLLNVSFGTDAWKMLEYWKLPALLQSPRCEQTH